MLETGEVVDRYTIEAVLGQGGMAVVYRVRHNQLDSHHALKILTITNPGVKDRLLQEGKVQASLRHPNIVAVTDVLEVAGAPGLVMEFIEGPGLDVWLQQNRPTLDQAVAIFEAVCMGVAHAHDKGVVHRDLKPANVMMAPASGNWVPKVADFGLAKAASGDGSLQNTRSGITMGTPQYMAPEQIRDAKGVDQRADVFSLGCILYELVCGRPPFVGPDILSIFNAVASGSYPAAMSFVPDLPPAVRDAIEGSLVVDRDARIVSVQSLLEVLRGAPLSERTAAASMERGGPNTTWHPGAPEMGIGVASVPQTSGAPNSASPSGSLTPPPASGSLPSQAAGRRRNRFVAGAVLVGVGVAGALGIAGVAGGAFVASRTVEASVREALGAHGDFAVGEIALGPTGLTLHDFAVEGPDGQQVVTVSELTLEGNPAAFAGEEWAVSRLTLSGVSGELLRGADGRFHLSASTESLLKSGIEFGLSADEVIIERGALTFRSETGSTELSWDGVALGDFRMRLEGGLAWDAATASLDRLDLGAADPVLRVGSMKVAGGRADLADVEVWVRGRTDGMLDLAPMLADEVADWAGGTRHQPESRPWLGVNLEGLPVTIREVQATSGTLHLTERSHGVKTSSWDVALDRLSVGPVGAERVPFGISGTLGDGRITVDGDVAEDGLIRSSLAARYLELDALEAYLAPSLAHYGVVPGKGTVDIASNLIVQGNTFAAVVDIAAANVSFDAGESMSRKGRRLLSPRDRVEQSVSLELNLASQDTEPVGRVLAAVVDLLFEPAGGGIVDADNQARRTRAHRRAAQEIASARAAASPEPEAPAVEEPRPAQVGGSGRREAEEGAAGDEPENPEVTAPEVTAPETEGTEVAEPGADNSEADAPGEEAERDPADSWKRFNRGVRDALDDFRIRRR